MQTENKLADDIARLAASGLGGLSSLKQEIERRIHEQIERVLQRADMVTREEFNVVKAMAEKARDEQETLQARLDKIEAALRDRGIDIA